MKNKRLDGESNYLYNARMIRENPKSWEEYVSAFESLKEEGQECEDVEGNKEFIKEFIKAAFENTREHIEYEAPAREEFKNTGGIDLYVGGDTYVEMNFSFKLSNKDAFQDDNSEKHSEMDHLLTEIVQNIVVKREREIEGFSSIGNGKWKFNISAIEMGVLYSVSVCGKDEEVESFNFEIEFEWDEVFLWDN